MALPTESHIAQHLDRLATATDSMQILGDVGPDAPLGDRQAEANAAVAAFLGAYAEQTRVIFGALPPAFARETVREQLSVLSRELDRCAALDELESAR